MLLSGMVTLGAFLLIGLGARPQKRSPLFMISGFVLIAFSLYLHVLNYSSVWLATAAIGIEMGLGFFLLAGLLSKETKSARSFYFLGAGALSIGVVLYAILQVTAPSAYQGSSSILVELGPDDTIEELSELFSSYQVDVEKAFPTISLSDDENLAQVYLVHFATTPDARLIDQLRSDTENVDHVEVNFSVTLSDPGSGLSTAIDAGNVLENDPLVSNQWALNAIHGHEAHALLANMSPIKKAKVAILDTGVDASHEDVSQTFLASPAINDVHGHGTHCAGLAGAFTNNGLGIASLNWEGKYIDILGYQALNEMGSGTIEMISQAIIDATGDEVDVISMSLGAKAETPKVISDAIQFARKRHVIVIASAGNANEDAKDHMPSSVEGVIVVSAVDENLRKASFSNTNTSLARPITAPGVNVLSLKTGGGYVEMSGTSMSTPVVSGLVGIMRALDPDISEERVYEILHQTGKNVQDSKRIGRLINASEAIQSVLDSR